MAYRTATSNRLVVATTVAFVAVSYGWIPRASCFAQRNPGSRSPAKSRKGELHTINDMIETLQQRLKAASDVREYTAMFHKTERVGQSLIEQVMDRKFRAEPLSVYLQFQSDKETGREVLFVLGRDDNQLLLHDSSPLGTLAGTQRLSVDDGLVKTENRYPITEIGLAKLLDRTIASWEAEKKLDRRNFKVRIVPLVNVAGTKCEMVEVIRKRQKAGFNYKVTRLYFAEESGLPIQAEQFGWPREGEEKPPLLERYRYSGIKTDVKLTDDDFDPRNSRYGFGK